jgi:hypothetical protein
MNSIGILVDAFERIEPRVRHATEVWERPLCRGAHDTRTGRRTGLIEDFAYPESGG